MGEGAECGVPFRSVGKGEKEDGEGSREVTSEAQRWAHQAETFERQPEITHQRSPLQFCGNKSV